jgi:hypothetical protein
VSCPILLHTALNRIICQFYQLLDYVSICLPARLIDWKKLTTHCIRFEAFATITHNGVFLSYQPPENEVSNHISDCLHLHELRWLTCLVFLFTMGNVRRSVTLFPCCLILIYFANGVHMLDSAMNMFPNRWAMSTVASCVAHNKSYSDWNSSEYLDIISHSHGGSLKKRSLLMTGYLTHLSTGQLYVAKNSMAFFSWNWRDYQVACSSGNSREHEQILHLPSGGQGAIILNIWFDS